MQLIGNVLGILFSIIFFTYLAYLSYEAGRFILEKIFRIRLKEDLPFHQQQWISMGTRLIGAVLVIGLICLFNNIDK